MVTTQLGALLRHVEQLAGRSGTRQKSDRELLEDFAARRDEGAFAALVGRHGPMVLRVCRRVLGHEQDAEDAFQATFLVLARNSASVRKHEALAGFLHGVAYRTAMHAKRSAARRRDHEGRLRPAVAAPAPTWNDVQAALDEEIQRLPEPLRAAFVLCVLEGNSGPQAAAALGCKAGTVSSRLTRARQVLRRRLLRRGIELSALLAELSVAQSVGGAGVPAALAGVTVRSGLLASGGETCAEFIPRRVAELAAGAAGAAWAGKLKVAAALLLAVGLAVAGARALSRPALATPPADLPRPAEEKPRAAKARAGAIDVRGRVLDPDGRPVPGARLVFLYASVGKVPQKVWATSTGGGRFQFSVPRGIEEESWATKPWDHTYVVAAAEGHGFAWARVRPEGPGDLTLRLVKDDVPIRGRVLDLEGKPVAGATVRIDQEVSVPNAGDLGAWLKGLRADNNPGYLGDDFTTLSGAALAVLFPPVRTGADGRFQIQGIGRERVARLHVEGPGIATQAITAMTRASDRVRLKPRDEPAVTYYGATFDLVAVPSRPVVGVVRDKDTGKPLPGVTVRSRRIAGVSDLNGLLRTTTDKDGRYRLVGLPKGPGDAIIAEARGRVPRPTDLPYLARVREVGDPPGLGPITIDLALKRGVWVKGRVMDKEGKGVPAGFDYFCFSDTPDADELPLPDGVPANWTQKDGSFRIVALPGRGLIAVRAERDEYRMAVGADRIKGPRVSEDFFDTVPYQLAPRNFHTIVEVSPKPGDESIRCDVVLDPGHTRKGTVVGPDGKPLAGARVAGLRPMGYWEREPLPGADFIVRALAPGERRRLQMIHERKKLAAWVEVRGDEKGPIRIRLRPWGSVVGRVVGPDGKPMTGVWVGLGSLSRARAGKDGTFRIDGLTPGRKYNLSVSKDPNLGLQISGKGVEGLTVGPGETKDVGDVRVKQMEE